jgi:hypothetical protein
MTTGRSLRSLLVISVSVVVSCCGLAACGGAGASQLCDQAHQVDKLTVTRIDHARKYPVRFSFPAKVTVTDPEKVRSVARELCALPVMPTGPMSCGANSFLGWYNLTFMVGRKRLPTVRLTDTCDEVRGLGKVRWTARTPGFWRVLGNAMGLPHANVITFLDPPSK